MSTCKKCNAQVEDGAGFCTSCGNIMSEPVFCPNCGQKTSSEFAFCQKCGKSISDGKTEVSQIAAQQANPTKQVNPKSGSTAKQGGLMGKPWFKFAAIALALVIIVGALVIFKPFSSKTKTSVIYVKDKELTLTFLNKIKPIPISDFSNTGAFSGNAALVDYEGIIKFNDAGTKMFYPEITTQTQSSVTYYYRDITKDLTKPDSPVKIDSEINSAIQISADGSKAFYIKGTDKRLYQNDFKDKIKLDSGVIKYYVNKAGDYIVYLLDDGTIYEKDLKKGDRVKIDSSAQIRNVFDDTTRLYYTKEGSLYFKEKGKDKVKQASNVNSIIAIIDKVGCYYTNLNETTVNLFDYVDDDMASADSALTKPTQAEYSKQVWSGYYYTTVIDYDSYNKALAAYNAKVVRDTLRTSLKTSVKSNTKDLFFYDGTKESLVSSNISDILLSSTKTPTVAYTKFTRSEIAKVKLSQITSKAQVESRIMAANSKLDEVFLAIKGAEKVFDQTKAGSYRFNYSQTAFCYLDEMKDGAGTLMEIKLADGVAFAPVKIDEDVNAFRYLNESDSVIYFKDVKLNVGDLYQNGKMIDSDVLITIVYSFKNSKTMLYFTDFSTKNKSGTLNMLKAGKVQKIADDVSAFVAEDENNIAYLTDYKYDKSLGDAQLYIGKDKPIKIDQDVNGLIWKTKMIDLAALR